MKQISHSIPLPTKTVNGRLRAVAVICASLVLAACAGGGSGADTQANAPAGGPTISSYTGPAPATADVQSFKINLYDNIRGNNRCGSCHSVAGGQAPMFARSDDVNIAYAEANPVVDLVVPSDSRIVQ